MRGQRGRLGIGSSTLAAEAQKPCRAHQNRAAEAIEQTGFLPEEAEHPIRTGGVEHHEQEVEGRHRRAHDEKLRVKPVRRIEELRQSDGQIAEDLELLRRSLEG